MAELAAPLIIIGAGRSGTSLLNALLGSHPQIHMLGEMDFTVALLWQCFWTSTAAQHERARRPQSGAAAECARACAVIRRALDDYYGLSAQPQRRWGFKEIWMSSFTGHDWTAYDAVFPAAFYLHLVRHPLDFARSVADKRGVPVTLAALRENLTGWVNYVRTNHARAATGRYFATTYEAFAADPRAVLAPVLAQLGITWDEACLAATQRRHVPSPQYSNLPAGAEALLGEIPGLAALMGEWGYAVTRRGAVFGQVATRLGGGRWRLHPPFPREGARGWLAELGASAELAPLADIADNLEHPQRSSLRLLEDGTALGPRHALHAAIREQGGGSFSHWGSSHYLLFSTSDGSDPNQNGRAYTIEWPAE